MESRGQTALITQFDLTNLWGRNTQLETRSRVCRIWSFVLRTAVLPSQTVASFTDFIIKIHVHAWSFYEWYMIWPKPNAIVSGLQGISTSTTWTRRANPLRAAARGGRQNQHGMLTCCTSTARAAFTDQQHSDAWCEVVSSQSPAPPCTPGQRFLFDLNRVFYITAA